MEVGDLVKPNGDWIDAGRDPDGLGLVIKIEESYYSKLSYSTHEDRIEVLWACGATTSEPESTLEVVSEAAR